MSFKSGAVVFKKLPFRFYIYLLVTPVILMIAPTALEHHFIYLPEPQHEATPASLGLAYEEIFFPASDGTRLNGWLLPGQNGAPVVLFCMGNAGNISHRLETLRLLHDLGVAVFIFNYRGYGLSAGRASEQGTYHDVAGAMRLLKERGWPAERMVIFGRSLGAAIGLDAALQDPPAGIIMESAFTSIKAMGQQHFPRLNLLLGWLIDARYDNRAKISGLGSPLLLIHGTEDTICPPHMAEELYSQATGEKDLFWIPGADHNDGFILGGEHYRKALAQVLALWTGFERQDLP